jgi:hypothetical protein
MVWLTLEQGEPFDRCLDADAAKTAAEAALDPNSPARGSLVRGGEFDRFRASICQCERADNCACFVLR